MRRSPIGWGLKSAERHRVTTQELGLLLLHQLFDVDDLHYGLWDEGLEVSPDNLVSAQQRFTEHLLAHLPAPDTAGGIRILDVGCGAGATLQKLLECGYFADGVSPSPSLSAVVKTRLAPHAERGARLFECPMEQLPLDDLRNRYDVVLFSESFQFIKIGAALDRSMTLLKTGGRLAIADVFRNNAEGDGMPGDGVIRGGHSLQKFYRLVGETPFRCVHDEDLTARVSPTIELLDQLLRERVAPATQSIARFLTTNHPLLSRLAGVFLGRQGRRVRDRYFGGLYSRATFEKYKSYRHFVYVLEGSG